MKSLKLLSVLAAVAVPTVASADYVCGVAQFPGNPSLPYRLRVTYSTGASCTGTTTMMWYCEKGVGTTSPSCAIDSLRFDKPELAALFGQLARAADSQQSVIYSTTSCGDGTVGCAYSVDFRY
ncbi:MAG TPA: hypothetical protein VE153_33775 [Myxococcus sp.]|nr:hypothetical protein [Myxococcus sp.]